MKRNSPSKVNLADTASRLIIGFDSKIKNLELDFKAYNQQLEPIALSIEKIEKVTSNLLAIKSSELHKEFLETHTVLTRLNKAAEATHKEFHKLQTDFSKKLQDPLLKGDFDKETKSVLDDIKSQVKKIEATFTIYKKVLEEIVDKCQSYMKRLLGVENLVNKICLPDQLEEASKINEKLNERFKTICEETALLQLGPNPQQFDPNKIQHSFLQLFNAHIKGGQLLDQIQKKIPIPPTTLLKSSESSASKENSNGINH